MPRSPATHSACAALLALVVPAAPAAALELAYEAASAATLGLPHDIVLSPTGDRLYVADNAKNRIVVLDAMSLAEQGVFGEGEVSAPHDVVFDADGRLLVADTGNSRIAVYAVSGASGRLVGELKGRVSRPEGVAVHRDGRVLATGAASGNLVAFRDGRVAGEVGGFSAPHDVELDRAGGIWVADANNDRVVRLDDALRVTAERSGPAFGFNGPRYLDFDDAGRMYVADKYTHRIVVIAPDGALVTTIGSGSAGMGPGVFDRPEGVEIRGRDVWFSDTYNNRIVRYRITSER